MQDYQSIDGQHDSKRVRKKTEGLEEPPSLDHTESGVEQKARAGWTSQQTAEQNAFPLFVHYQTLW